MTRTLRKLAFTMLATLGAGCSLPGVAPAPAPAAPVLVMERAQADVVYSPIELDLVQAIYAASPPAHALRIGRAEAAVPEDADPDSVLLREVRSRAAWQGGTMVTWRRLTPTRVEFVIVRDAVIAGLSDQRLAARGGNATTGGSVSSASSIPVGSTDAGCLDSCPVPVRASRRRNGTSSAFADAAQFYAHSAINVRSRPSRTSSLLRTVARGDAMRLGAKDANGWAVSYDAAGQVEGYVYRASNAVRASTPADRPRYSAARTRPTATRQRHSAAHPRSTARVRRSSSGSNGYYTGPRGGCYTYSASGRKRYVDHSYCR